MTRTRRTAAFPAARDQTARARHWLAAFLGPGHPCADTAVLLLSEAFTNSVLHSRSSAPGGTIQVTADLSPSRLHIEVTDAGAPTVPPVPTPAALDAENGRGLHLLAALAEDWGHTTLPTGHLRTHFALPVETAAGVD